LRFVPDGPEVPNLLLSQWRDGKVVFLAGAGVSVALPSDLPSFKKLVLLVYQKLKDPLFEAIVEAQKAGSVEERNKYLSSCNLSAERIVEGRLYFKEEYDRLFAALESRLDQDSNGLVVSQRVRDTVASILRQHGGCNKGHRDLIQLSIASRQAAGNSSRSTCRVATTNFDLLLEDAAALSFSSPLASFDARTAPRPGSYDFEGIIHLHGMLDVDVARPGNLILSSRDFARTYLRSGVAANYIYDLARRYRLILIGYSADDPTMRYLMDAVGEDAALFDDMNKPYAIAARDASDTADFLGDVFAATWRAKNIEPCPYDLRKGGDS
jgi:hypothetical protein